MRKTTEGSLYLLFAASLVGVSWLYGLSVYGFTQITLTAWYEVWAPTIFGVGLGLYGRDLQTGYSAQTLS